MYNLLVQSSEWCINLLFSLLFLGEYWPNFHIISTRIPDLKIWVPNCFEPGSELLREYGLISLYTCSARDEWCSLGQVRSLPLPIFAYQVSIECDKIMCSCRNRLIWVKVAEILLLFLIFRDMRLIHSCYAWLNCSLHISTDSDVLSVSTSLIPLCLAIVIQYSYNIVKYNV